MNIVEIEGFTREIPASWNELSRSQLVAVFNVIHKAKKDIAACKILVLEELLSLPRDTFYSIHTDQLALMLAQLLEWMFVEQDGKTSLSLGLTENKIKHLKTSRGRFFGPRERLRNITYYEFAKCEIEYQNYAKGKVSALNRLIAILYRPRKTKVKSSLEEGDIRAELMKVETLTDKRAEAISKMSAGYRYSILHFYESVRHKHIVGYKDEQGNVHGFYDVFHSESKGEGNRFGHIGVILELAGPKFGTQEQTANTNLYVILMYLSMLEERRQKAEAEQILKQAKK